MAFIAIASFATKNRATATQWRLGSREVLISAAVAVLAPARLGEELARLELRIPWCADVLMPAGVECKAGLHCKRH